MGLEIKRELFMESSGNDWEARAILNPSVLREKGVEHMFYRAVAKNKISSVGYARIIKGEVERFDEPVLFPTRDYEKKGIEDSRVTKVGSNYYLLYTAFDGKDARVAYAVSKDLKRWKKKGIISPGILVSDARKLVKIKKYRDNWKLYQNSHGNSVLLWDKDAVLFPEKIDGHFVMLHRFLPDIQIVKFKSFSKLKDDDFWRDYISNLSEAEDKVSLYRRYNWEGEHIGAGAVPIKTKRGWLLIYHGVELRKNILTGLPDRIYHTGAALLDLKKPETEITRLEEPLFSPKYKWEKSGDMNNVVFPEGAVVEGDKLKIYYGCSDSRIGLATMSFKKLMKEFK
ncbi:MAG: pesticidal protein Cry7Aa [archaeon]